MDWRQMGLDRMLMAIVKLSVQVLVTMILPSSYVTCVVCYATWSRSLESTFEGTVHETFQAAALALGLLESDIEWDRCLREAGEMVAYPRLIRKMFCYILANCSPADPLQLWNDHRDRMSDDFFFQQRSRLNLNSTDELDETQNEVYQRALGDIDAQLQTTGSRLSDYPTLPQDTITAFDTTVDDPEILEVDEYDADAQIQYLDATLPLLNDDQQQAYQHIVDSINSVDSTSPTSRLFFVNGPGGTGKSLLFKVLLAHVRSRNQIALPVASSGIAAILLPGGRTAHSRFKIPMNADADTSCYVRLGTRHARLLSAASLIIWDEAVMCAKFNFEAVDRLLKDIMGAENPLLEHVPFGGKVVVFSGDFRQLVPVVKRAMPSEVMSLCIKSASFWDQVIQLRLTINMRVQGSSTSDTPHVSAFANKLLDIGDGKDPYSNEVEIPSEWLMDAGDIPRFVKTIYPFLGDSSSTHTQHFRNRIIIAARNADVDNINAVAHSLFPGQHRTYESTDTIVDSDDPEADMSTYPPEFLQSLHPSGMPAHVINLKVGMPLVVLRNIDPDNGLCNGTRVYVVALYERSILIKRYDEGSPQYLLPRIHHFTQDQDYPFRLRRTQLPVRPAFAMTIHKSQGQTMDHVGVYLKEPVFSHGQLYVALSRVTHPLHLKVVIPFQQGTNQHKTKNIVYKQILSG